jgi:O-methyltransferase involved in polyketide biosynthesis
VLTFKTLIDRFLLATKSQDSRQIITLGSGYDTISFEYAHLEGLKFFEVDFPEIIDEKERFINAEPALLASVGAPEPGVRRDYGVDFGLLKLVSSDLRNSTDTLSKLFSAGCDGFLPTLILTECVLVCK